MKAVLFFLVVLSSWILCAQERRVLAPHETVYIPVDPGIPVEVSRSDILSIKDLEDKLQVRAKKRGSCTVRVGEKVYHFEVVSTDSAHSYRRVDKGSLKGLKLSPGKNGVIVTGKLLRVSDYEKLLGTMAPGWSFQAEVPLDLQPELLSFLHEELINLGQPELLIKFTPSPRALLPPGGLARYRPALRKLGLRHSVSSTSMAPRPSLPVTFVLAEISQQALKDLGVRPEPSTQVQILPKLATAQEVMVQLDHFSGRGLAKRLAQPRLILSSGQAAKYHSGGEVPVRSSGFASSQVHWKSYGLIIEAKAHFNAENQMDLDLQLELSSLDSASGTADAPGILKKRFENHIFMDPNKPVVLVDFLDLQSVEQSSGLPVVSSIPLLGSLFKSQGTRYQDSRFCLLILPNF